ncbi:MAG: alpha/beta hydrolase [Chromatiales bacterium]|nr:MAG: alpha/beta hydrolase [Chromatiales bacterium]
MKWLLFALLILAMVVALAIWILDSGRLDLSLAELENRYVTPDSRFADVDGVRVHYVDQGEGPAALLLHASFMNLRTWDSMARSLKDNFRVIRPDLLIAGLTGPEPSGDYSFDRNLELVDGLMNQLGIERFAIVATSSGGIVGFNYAARQPDRVSRLVLINSAGLPRTRATDPNRGRRQGGIGRWIADRYQTPDKVRSLLALNFVPPNQPPDWLVAMNYDMWRRAGRRREAALQMQGFRTGDPQAVLAAIAAPTLILWGLDNATVMHLEADVFQHWLVNAPTLLKKYPGVGHYLYLETPAVVEADIKSFLSGELDGQLLEIRKVPYTADGLASSPASSTN